MKLIKRDVVLWLRHLEEAGMTLQAGCAVLFRLADADILFEPMRPGPSGRPTRGLRATGSNRAIWASIPLGATIDVELARVIERDMAAPAADVATPRLRRTGRAASPSPSNHRGDFFEAVELHPSRVPTFDAYVMVDWSASSSPRIGKDSVWWCLCVWRSGELVVEANENSPTRQACFDALRAQLRDLVVTGSSVLVGFDFPFGYPAGFAEKLSLDGAPWRAVWNELSKLVADNQAGGTNNRFQVASSLNLRIGAPEGPFWGRPQDRTYDQLHATEPTYPVGVLDRLREADRHARGVQPVWKLWGNGSVGGQTLLGVPILARLRDDDHLRGLSAVWPFETGCRLPPRSESRIIFAETYPSMVKLPAELGGRVKDSAQVEAIARHLARHDATDTLGDLFAGPATLEPAVRARVETEEGWILGVETMRIEPRAFTRRRSRDRATSRAAFEVSSQLESVHPA